MGLLDFLDKGGSGIISTGIGLIAGRNQARKDRIFQAQQQEKQNEFAKEMYLQQTKDEMARMKLQNQWNIEAAKQSQEYAKEMFDYTGYEAQVEQMKKAGLNPALMSGASGSAGQASAGATQEAATAMQPMGLQIALQAKQAQANIALTEAQTMKTRAEASRENITNFASSAMEMFSNSISNAKSKKEMEKLEHEIKNIDTTNEQIKANIEVLKENKELLKFQNDINKIIQNSVAIDDNGNSYDWQQTIVEKYFAEFKSDIARLDKEEREYLTEKETLERLSKDIEAIDLSLIHI